jgi:hypothetical protein
MESCESCGAALNADAQWCGQCYAVRASASVTVPTAPDAEMPNRFGGTTASVLAAPARMARPSELPPTVVKSRWRKSATTFGPVGRIVATIALVVPFILFVVISIFTGGMVLAAPVIWGFVIMPWGLRDTWRAGQVSSG